MDAEDKKKLDRVLKLAEENNEYIRKVRRTQKTSQMWTAIYWVLIIMSVLGSFYFIQPFINSITKMYGVSSGTGLQTSDMGQVQKLIDQFKK